MKKIFFTSILLILSVKTSEACSTYTITKEQILAFTNPELSSFQKLQEIEGGIAQSIAGPRLTVETYKKYFEFSDKINNYKTNGAKDELKEYILANLKPEQDIDVANYFLLQFAKFEFDEKNYYSSTKYFEKVTQKQEIPKNFKFVAYLGLVKSYIEQAELDKANQIADEILNCNLLCNDYIKKIRDIAGY